MKSNANGAKRRKFVVALTAILLFLGPLYYQFFFCYCDEELKLCLEKGLREDPRELCDCSQEKFPLPSLCKNIKANSTCSLEATLLGDNQDVISFSLYDYHGGPNNHYFDGILANLKLQKEFYPNWIIRVYTNIRLTKGICKVVCADPNIFFCNTTKLPVFGKVNMDERTWRFLALNDPTVRKFISRDLDSRLSSREREAVRQWEKSDWPLHGMRDHPWHEDVIMAGMWGGNNQKLNKDLAKKFQREIIAGQESNDQALLKKVIYPHHKDLMMIHDSYICQKLNDSIPFPTQRLNNTFFVGWRTRIDDGPVPECPVPCRPPYGKDWKYC